MGAAFRRVPACVHVHVLCPRKENSVRSCTLASSSGSGSTNSSPLLLLKDNRHYSFALLEGATLLQGAEAAPADRMRCAR